jgi:hypothetical protein
MEIGVLNKQDYRNNKRELPLIVSVEALFVIAYCNKIEVYKDKLSHLKKCYMIVGKSYIIHTF